MYILRENVIEEKKIFCLYTNMGDGTRNLVILILIRIVSLPFEPFHFSTPTKIDVK